MESSERLQELYPRATSNPYSVFSNQWLIIQVAKLREENQFLWSELKKLKEEVQDLRGVVRDACPKS